MPHLGRLCRASLAGLAALVVLSCVMGPSAARAQGVGAINGVIRNGETGETLDYANVVLTRLADQAQWGAMSLGGGRFFLNGIPAGEYELKVLYLGFKPVTEQVTVVAGETQNLTFDLEVTVVKQFDIFTVEGSAIMVEVKETETAYTIGSEDLTDYAVDSVEEAVARQAGVVSRNGELHVRGGRSGEISFRVDGVAVDDPLGGGALSVSTFSVGKIETVTGGQDPEYGNALSGVVNIETREGSDDFEFNARFTTDDFGRQDRTFTNYDRLELGFGGPSGIDRLTYWFAGDFTFTDQENYNRALRPETKVDLFGIDLFKYRRRQFNDVKGSLKVAYTFDEKNTKKLTGEYITNYTRSEPYLPNWDVQGYVRQVVRLPVLDNAGQVLEFTGGYRTFYYGPWIENIQQIAVTRPVRVDTGSGTTIQALPVIEARDTRGNLFTCIAQPVFVGARNPDGLYSTVPEDSSYVFVNSANQGPQNERLSSTLKFVWRQTLTDDTFYTLKLSRVEFDRLSTVNDTKLPTEFLNGAMRVSGPFGGETNQYLGGGVAYYTDPDQPVFVTDGSDWFTYQDQITKQYSIAFDITSNRYEGHKLKTGLQIVYNDLENEFLVNPGTVVVDRFTGISQQGAARNLFHTYNPEASFYIQDRWEYEGMVINGGFRWDMFSPGSEAQIAVDNEELDRNVYKYKHQLSPRLGFAFPITDRAGFNFSYGRFVQFPGRDVLFASQSTVGNTGVLGNPNLDAMLTIQYQTGIQQQFNDYLAGTFAVYNRDIYGLISATEVTDEATGNTLARYINRAYGNARGMEFTLERRFHNRWAFEIAYTYAFADGVASNQEFGANPNGLQFLPNQELPLDWDVRHQLALNLRIAQPGAWAASITFDYGSGFPWTPFFRFERRQDPLLENSARHPSTYDLRLQAERNVNFYGQNLTLYLQGLNLLNEDEVVGIAPALNPGLNNGVQNAGNPYLTETGKYGGAYLQDIDGDTVDDFVPLNDPRVFGQHRLFRVGIGWRF